MQIKNHHVSEIKTYFDFENKINLFFSKHSEMLLTDKKKKNYLSPLKKDNHLLRKHAAEVYL